MQPERGSGSVARAFLASSLELSEASQKPTPTPSDKTPAPARATPTVRPVLQKVFSPSDGGSVMGPSKTIVALVRWPGAHSRVTLLTLPSNVASTTCRPGVTGRGSFGTSAST